MAGYDVVNRELNSRTLGHRGEPDAFPSGSGGNRADAKTPVPQIDGDRAFYFGCTPRDELQPGSGAQGNFRVPILATLRPRAACLCFLPEPSGQLPRKIPCNPLLRSAILSNGPGHLLPDPLGSSKYILRERDRFDQGRKSQFGSGLGARAPPSCARSMHARCCFVRLWDT